MNISTKNILKRSGNKGMSMAAAVIIILLLLFAQACSNSDPEVVEPTKRESLTMNMKSASEALINNASLYVFNYNSVIPSSPFLRKQLNITRNGDILSADMVVGRYNLVLLSSESDISGNIKLPVLDSQNNLNSPMWVTGTTETGGNSYLKEMPELRYAPIFGENNVGVLINEGQRTTATASLDRNVAKIQIILDEYSGFDLPVAEKQQGKGYFELYSVPTTLSWEGRLLPNANKPDTLPGVSMRKYLTFGSDGKADTLNFIVPAHRPRNASDLATNKIRLKGCMILGNAPYFGQSADRVAIEHTPRPNTIIQVHVKFRGEPDTNLDIKVNVKEWGNVEQEVIFPE